jgi:hypothetical protein
MSTDSIDLGSERTLSLSQAARILPPGRRGRPVTLSCVLRWVLEGVRLPSGEAVRLEAMRLGGRWLTSMEALQRFAARQTPDLERCSSAPTLRTPARRRKAVARAEAALQRAGF